MRLRLRVRLRLRLCRRRRLRRRRDHHLLLCVPAHPCARVLELETETAQAGRQQELAAEDGRRAVEADLRKRAREQSRQKRAVRREPLEESRWKRTPGGRPAVAVRQSGAGGTQSRPVSTTCGNSQATMRRRRWAMAELSAARRETAEGWRKDGRQRWRPRQGQRRQRRPNGQHRWQHRRQLHHSAQGAVASCGEAARAS